MKKHLLIILFLLAYNLVYGGDYHKVIVPVTIDMLQDTIIKHEVFSILHERPNDSLHEYKTKCNSYTITNSYKGSGWWFITTFTEKINSKTCLLQAYCPADTLLVPKIRFFHVKAMLAFPTNTLTEVNKEITAAFAGESIICTAMAYISKSRLRNYLLLSIKSKNKGLDFVFVISHSQLYQCVINRSS